MAGGSPVQAARRRFARRRLSACESEATEGGRPESSPHHSVEWDEAEERVMVPPSLDDLVDDLDEIPIEAAKRLVLPSQRGLRPHAPLEDEDVGLESLELDSFLEEPLEEPLRLPKVPLAVRLADSKRPPTPRVATAPQSARGAAPPMSARSTWATTTFLSPQNLPLCAEDLERTLQNVDFGRLEVGLREVESRAAAQKPHEGVANSAAREESLTSTADGSGSAPLAGLVELEAMESVFSADGEGSLQETTCDEDELQLLFDPSRGVCGGGCRFAKFAVGFRHLRGPDDDVVGGLQAFLSRADDSVLSYILQPARGPPAAEAPAGGALTAL